SGPQQKPHDPHFPYVSPFLRRYSSSSICLQHIFTLRPNETEIIHHHWRRRSLLCSRHSSINPQPCSQSALRRPFISVYAISISFVNAATSTSRSGASFTCRMNLPVPSNRPFA